MRANRSMALGALAAIVWAVSSVGTAHSFSRPTERHSGNETRPVARAPLPARFRVQKDTGLLIRVWLNGAGPYIFAIDTGAGLNVITERTAKESQLPVRNTARTTMGGLSAARISSSREVLISKLAVGDIANALASPKTALIVPDLAPGVDGILDPTESYSPFGYSIDISRERIEAIDTNLASDTFGARARLSGSEGTVVPWLRVGDGTRPFVRLGDGRIALVDTGSSLGLGVSERNAVVIGGNQRRSEGIRDIGGGTIFSRRVSPSTISIGELVLRGIPTDILSQVSNDAPVILGRDALYPFKITFDPRRRLIEFVTSAENN